jgi:NADH:ubiquinone oxidoreductase subunit 6 (subunit J)
MIVFYLIAAALVLGAIYIVTAKNIMHAVFMHLLVMVMVAVIYILLYAEFLAAMQVLVYAGAVTIMIVFALMLTKSRGTPEGLGVTLDNKQKGMAFVTSAGFLATILYVLIPQKWPVFEKAVTVKSGVQAMGKIIFSTYVLPFEIISVLLLAALVGVIVLARKED